MGEKIEDMERRWNDSLNRLGLRGWTAAWSPGKGSKRGEILLEERLIVIYDREPAEAWDTFLHEIVELKLRPVLRPYRDFTNALITLIEKLVYAHKERFIDELPDLLEIISRAEEQA